MDDYDSTFGCYGVFRSRGRCLDYLADTVFERAETLEVPVTDQSAPPVRDELGDLVFPKMTREEVRDQLASGLDFGLVLRTSETCFGELSVEDQVTVGVREAEVLG